MGGDPGERRVAHLVGVGRERLDPAELDRLARAEELAFEQVGLRRHQAELAHGLGDPGRARISPSVTSGVPKRIFGSSRAKRA